MLIKATTKDHEYLLYKHVLCSCDDGIANQENDKYEHSLPKPVLAEILK